MDNVKMHFSIKDLENISGIKAHTIRAWESRYNLLHPDRSDTNIRSYSLSNLQKLLSITSLYNRGAKISKIASMKDAEMAHAVLTLKHYEDTNTSARYRLKVAMLNFDEALLEECFILLSETKDFKSIFLEVYAPFLAEVGQLWLTKSISPAHEHFVSAFIKRKIFYHIEQASTVQASSKRTYVLFLPIGEIHDIGLSYLYYELKLKGCHCIYLGENMPLSSLVHLKAVHKDLVFISSMTVRPHSGEMKNYIEEVEDLLLNDNYSEWWACGSRTQLMRDYNLHHKIKIFNSLKQVVQII